MLSHCFSPAAIALRLIRHTLFFFFAMPLSAVASAIFTSVDVTLFRRCDAAELYRHNIV